MATLTVTQRADLTDAQWAVLEPLLPRGRKPGRPPSWTKRQLIDGIRWRVRTGAPWRDVPERYGRWQTVYGLFRRWQRNGTWRAVLTRLQGRADAAGLITWDVSVDSTIARAHHPRKDRPDPQPQEQRPGGRPPARLRPRTVQAAPRGRMRHRPPQAQPRRRHPLRQAGRPLPGHPPHRRDQRVAPPGLMKHA